MPNKTWKNLERKVAKVLNGQRTPVSGCGAIKGDVQHSKYFIECKWGKQIPKTVLKWHDQLKKSSLPELVLHVDEIPKTIYGWYHKAEEQAGNKIPLLIMKPKNVHNEFVFGRWTDVDYSFTTLKQFAMDEIRGGSK